MNFLHEEDIKRNSKKKRMEGRGLWKSMTSPVTIAKLHWKNKIGNYTEQKAITLLILAKKQQTNYLQVVISKPVLKLIYHRMNITHGLYRKIHLKLF